MYYHIMMLFDSIYLWLLLLRRKERKGFVHVQRESFQFISMFKSQDNSINLIVGGD